MSTKRKKRKGNQKIWAALNQANKTEGPWDSTIVKVIPEVCANCLLGPHKLVTDRHRDAILFELSITSRVL